ncbi:MAG: COG4280 domain-containing protein [Acidimicrobiales bacterium]
MTSTIILALAVFGASSVEMVEAFTIVLAAGVSRGWRSAIEGTIAAVVTLAVIVVAVGVPLIHLVPLDALRVVVGGLLLVLGLNWLRKAVLRSSGHKALHDEDAIYARTVNELSTDRGAVRAGADPGGVSGPWRSQPRDATGFTVAFKGVFLEGLEVVMIVLTLGSSAKHLGLAAAAAAAAVVVVGTVGVLVARQLSEVPENALKMGVGIMLSSFGVFWVGEGAGLNWPGSDLFLLGLVAIFASTAGLLVLAMRRVLPPVPSAAPRSEPVRT